MTEKQPTLSDRLGSACNTMLKLLSELYVKTRHNLGLIVIDRGMRDTLAWYDRKHPAGTPRRKIHEAESNRQYLRRIDDLSEALDREREAHAAEKKRADHLISERNILRDRKQQLEADLNAARSQCAELERASVDLRHDFEARMGALQRRTEDLLRRCLPETEIPSMVYYAEGDASGLYLRKLSTMQATGHIYRITTYPGNTSVANFEPYINNNLPYIIDNRSVFLTACDIKGISSNPSIIRVITPGEAKMEEGRWKVTRRAIIELTE